MVSKQRIGLIVLGVIAAIVIGAGVMAVMSSNKPASQSSKSTATNPEPTANNGAPQQSEVKVEIKDMAFSPSAIQVKKGAKVTWTNQDTMQHNVMKEHEGGDEAHEAVAPTAVNPDIFAGPLLAKGQSYSFTFNEVGTFLYHCAPHPNMKRTVTVVE